MKVAQPLTPPGAGVLDGLPKSKWPLTAPGADVLDNMPIPQWPVMASAGDVRRSSSRELAAALHSVKPLTVRSHAQLADALMRGQSVVASKALVTNALNPYADGSLAVKVHSSDSSTFVSVGNVALGGSMCNSANTRVVITPMPNGDLLLTPTSLLAKHGSWSLPHLLVPGESTGGSLSLSPQETHTLQSLQDAGVFPRPFVSR